ncbi:alpha-L-fucosidase [Thermatribacter velox]|uniref:Alpha-L-fucosidase n=1 Tax=Thermatribacter velox TaxID=3039681 RepID=A0ABZ2YE81_9BACT
MSPLPFRQVHLDFHTSPFIPDVAQDFDPEEFAQTLLEARVNSINIFARCHHGYCYYPTKVGKMHPSLKRDLLGEMIEALHQRGIRCPIYTSVAWDELSASEHPDWRQIDSQGRLIGRAPLENKGWQFLCLNSPYLDYLEEHVKELIELYGAEIDGLWFDIIIQHPDGCFCPHCQKSMHSKGLRVDVKEDRLQHNLLVERKAMQHLSQLVKSKLPEALVVFNARMRLQQEPQKGLRSEIDYMTHLEIESLPTGGWGYLHFPMMARYCLPLGKEVVGMTGRFHLIWGDFGGLKSKAALLYECFRCLALGAKCSIGDQLHPRGKLDEVTYKLIGSVYEEVAKKEKWCEGAELQADIGVLVCSRSEGPALGFGEIYGKASDEGATLLLTELHHQFHLIDKESDFDHYFLIIAPDEVLFDAQLVQKIRCFLEKGGKLILSHESGLDINKKDFALPELGLRYLGPSPFEQEYLRISEVLPSLDQKYDYILYERGSRVSLLSEKGEILGRLVRPYFNRSWKAFCSHGQTPPAELTEEPAIVQIGGVIYITHPIFAMYRKWAYPVYRKVVGGCIDRLLPFSLVRVSNFPVSGEITVLRKESSLLLHLLYFPITSKGELQVVEDLIPLQDVRISLRVDFNVERVRCIPEDQILPFQQDGKYISFTVPKIEGHQMIIVE